jgi:hypothetical protein
MLSPSVRVGALATNAITPTLTISAPSVVGVGETFTISGTLGISRESGDINGDGRIDLKDYYRVVAAYGSYPGHQKWDPEADLNGDGKVDLKDLYIVAGFYGQWAGYKQVEIQQWDGEQWVTLGIVTATPNENAGEFSLDVQAPSQSTTLYFRAYFPGGVY